METDRALVGTDRVLVGTLAVTDLELGNDPAAVEPAIGRAPAIGQRKGKSMIFWM